MTTITKKINYTSTHISKKLAQQTLEPNNLDTLDYVEFQSQTGNPKIAFFEDRVAALEGGSEGLALPSFREAVLLLFKSLLSEGDEVISYNSRDFYLQYSNKLSKTGIKILLQHESTIKSLVQTITPATKVIFIETISKDDFDVPDFLKIVTIAKEFEIPVIVDNSAAFHSYFARPFFYGADLIISRIDPLFSDSDTNIKSILIDSGKYNWFNGKFAKLTSLGNGNNTDKNPSLISYLRERSGINNEKSTLPLEALNLLKTFEESIVKVQKYASASLDLAKVLHNKAGLEQVNYLGLPNHRSHFKALTYLRNGFGNQISFSIAGGGRSYEIFAARLAQFNSPKKFKIKFDLENQLVRIKIENEDPQAIEKVIDAALSYVNNSVSYNENNIKDKVLV